MLVQDVNKYLSEYEKQNKKTLLFLLCTFPTSWQAFGQFLCVYSCVSQRFPAHSPTLPKLRTQSWVLKGNNFCKRKYFIKPSSRVIVSLKSQAPSGAQLNMPPLLLKMIPAFLCCPHSTALMYTVSHQEVPESGPGPAFRAHIQPLPIYPHQPSMLKSLPPGTTLFLGLLISLLL